MASTDNAENTTPMHDLKTDPEKAAQPESDLGGETEPDPEDARGPIPGDKPGDATKLEDAGPPDGGAAAWLVVLGAWCCSFSSPGWINSVGSFQQYYEVGPLKDYSSSAIAWIPSLQIFFLFALGPVVGIIFDNYGPRPLIIGGTLLHVFGLMMASLAKTYYQFILSQGVCSAIGVASLACVSTWFSKKRGAAMGIMVTGSSVGGVIFPIMISRMIQSTGYPWAMRTAAFLILGLQVIAILTVRPRTKPVPKKMPAGRFAAPFREFPFVMLLLGIFVLTYGIFIPIDYLAVQGFQEAHMSEEMAQYLVSIFNAASLFGRLVAGYGADIIGRWNMFIIACALSGISEFAVWIPAKHSSIAIGFAIMFGFASGAFIGLSGALPVSVSPLPEIGYRLGVVFLAISIPALTMAPIGGAILQNSVNGWLDVKIFGGVMCLAGSAIILVSRLLYTEKKLLKVF
ncbi:major facilitator superfamily domain-containing protein [Diplogelasinospora grovesii]|uniref:Major facilitator superfamily domain-containing protein n=1 Tax=Diplogelasinospora grovesii TaxID=303347 RepID=A0AAN6S411_9PEZI|nr:major facilitator superfamily domain-containing protein [Diplogelasinospora grovesii]